MIFRWLRERRRLRLLTGPFPKEWLGWLERAVPIYPRLSAREQIKIRKDIRLFVGEKIWEGCGGLDLIDEMKVTIASQACLMILGLDYDHFRRVQSILVYPDSFTTPHPKGDEIGIIEQSGSERLGETWYRGPIILSWADILEDVEHSTDGISLVFHELAHKLDMLDGVVDGTPPLGTDEQQAAWREVMTAEFKRLEEAADRDEETLLDPYGARDEAEFFAVATECFFGLPGELMEEHPKLYRILRNFYCQDPAARYN